MVEKSYIAGQEFSRRTEEGRRHVALGWSAELTIIDDMLRSAPAAAGLDTEYCEVTRIQVSGGSTR